MKLVLKYSWDKDEKSVLNVTIESAPEAVDFLRKKITPIIEKEYSYVEV